MAAHEHHDQRVEPVETSHAGHEHHGHAGEVTSTGSVQRSTGSTHEHSAHDPAIFRRKFWLSLILTIPTLVFSQGLQDILGLAGPRFPGSQFIPAAFGLAIFVYGGLVFLKGAITELRAKQPGMMTLISLAIIVALGYSLAVTLGLPGMDFWWELATLITIMLLGHWIEMSAVMGAQNALGELAKLLPDEAELLHGDHPSSGGHSMVAVSELTVGDHVFVRPGAAIPVDGRVVDGASEVNEAVVTGESAPVAKSPGAEVIGGSTNGSGALTVEVTKVGSDTALAGIMRLVAEAQSSKSSAQVLADRAAALLFYVALAASIVTLVVWLILRPDDPSFVLERVVSVLVIACPHALGLAIPLVSQISTALGARSGILVRKRIALEEARAVDVVLFDKTGTLTRGEQGIVAVQAEDGADDELLALAAAVEADSEHPIARAIVAESDARGLLVAKGTAFDSHAGRGATASVEGRVVSVGSAGLVRERGFTVPRALAVASTELGAGGATVVYVFEGTSLDDSSVLGLIALADVLRPESAEAVAELKRRGVRVAMLTGDSQAVGDWVAGRLGIDEVHAEVLPGGKADVVRRLQAGGARVAMVGDGVNDAPALAQANVGIAIGAGTDVAIESAGIVLASSDPRSVVDVLTLSRATWRKELQNLFWATGYNAVGIPLAAGAAFGVGLLLPPALAAVFMSVSTIIVAANAQLLRLTKLGVARRQ